MKAKELIQKLSYNLEAEVFFEEDGHNREGEPEEFPFALKDIYGDDREITIVLVEN